MRLYTRIIFGLNLLYQGLVGAVSLALPGMAIGLYNGTEADQKMAMLRAAFRLIGINILFGAVISALIAKNPDKHPVLLPLMGVLSILTLVCWGVAFAAGEMTFSQFALDLIVQPLLMIGAFGYYAKAKKANQG